MNKGLRLIKKMVALILVLLLSIENFAAVVGDNDGAAFITKAEFDSLKNDFQSQIDQYNTSIDAKIDGAIASYLAGISVANATEENVIGYDKEGVLSPRAGSKDLRWKEGMMKYDWENWDTRFGRDYAIYYVTYANVKVTGKTPTEFTELALKNVDRINGTAEWIGKCQTLQFTRAKNALHQDQGAYSYDILFSANTWELTHNNGPFPVMLNNGQYQNMDDGSVVTSNPMFSVFGTKRSSGVGTTYTKYMNYESQNFSRTTKSTSEQTIIITPTSVSETRFSDFDTFLDINNDEYFDEKYTDDAGTEHYYHTHMSSPYVMVGSISSYAYQTGTNTSTQFTNSVNGWVVTSPVHTYTTRKRQQLLPYFGFTRQIRNYNKLWTSKYDSYIEDIEKTDTSLNAININGTKHLRLSAGLPICAVKAGTWVELPITFQDKTINYDLYVKIGSFGSAVAPQDDTKCIDNSKIYYGTYSSYSNSEKGTTEKSIKIRNGNDKIVFECQENGYLFLKWSIAGNSGAGGGRLLIPKKITTFVQ